jgi:hypothetical protein
MVSYIGLGDLIKNKQASGRAKDIVDVKELKKQKKSARKK